MMEVLKAAVAWKPFKGAVIASHNEESKGH